jgi:D-arabinose 1-dehydrogenase-like Zn-dependent alcohol dehydrogenase
MKSVIVPKAGGVFTATDRPLPEPDAGMVRLKVEACGVCHSDVFVKEGQWPGLNYPRAPGHEAAGVVDAVGAGVTAWKVGDRAGIGWHGNHCGVCDPCRAGDFICCERLQITGFHFDGGYQQFMIAPERGLAHIPDGLSAADAAPLMCAGVTTYNSLRHAGAMPGDVVAVHGVGGLGHLGVQFARQSGFHTIAISRGKDKEELALKLGAHRYIDSGTQNVAKELKALGGARVILATAPSGKAITELLDGLGRNGKMLVVGAFPDSVQVTATQLIGNRNAIQGWPSGTSKDSEDTLKFCALTGVRPMIETFPLEEAAKAYERMITNQVRFRAVLVNS